MAYLTSYAFVDNMTLPCGLTFAGKSVSLKARVRMGSEGPTEVTQPGVVVTMDCEDTIAIVAEGCPSFKLEGFTILNGRNDTYAGGLTLLDVNRVTLNRVSFINCSNSLMEGQPQHTIETTSAFGSALSAVAPRVVGTSEIYVEITNCLFRCSKPLLPRA